MKRIIRNTYILSASALLFLNLMTSCGGDDGGPSNRELFIESIIGTWEVDESSYIIIDDQNITDLFLGFEITINDDLTYMTNSNELTMEEFPWTTSGSFTLNDALTRLTREDGLVITILVDEEAGLLDLEFSVTENGRLNGIRGGWKCGLKKKS